MEIKSFALHKGLGQTDKREVASFSARSERADEYFPYFGVNFCFFLFLFLKGRPKQN